MKQKMQQIIINIDDETYDYVKQYYRHGIGAKVACNLGFAVAKGTPLPKELGRWEEVWDKDHLTMLAYKCSKCEVFSNTTPNYCPNCGIKMENGKEVKVIYRMPSLEQYKEAENAADNDRT